MKLSTGSIKYLINAELLTVFMILMFFDTVLYAQRDSNIYAIPIDSLWNMTVSGISRFTQPLEKAPNNVIVITEQQIKARGYKDLSDVLKDIPCFDITGNASRYGDYLTMRGIQGNEHILVLIDGHKLNPPTGTFLSIGNSISIDFVKQIEIIYGPASAVYGADAFAGIINIISKDNDKNKTITTLATSYGSLNTIDSRFSSRTKINDNLSFTLFGRMYNSDGINVVGRDTCFDIITRYQEPYPAKCEQPIHDYSIFAKINYRFFTIGYFRQMFDEGNGLALNPDKNLYSETNKWKSSTDNIWAAIHRESDLLGTFTADFNIVSFKINKNTQYEKWLNAYETNKSFSQYMTGADLALKGSLNLHKLFNNDLHFICGVDYEFIQSIPPYANDQLFGNSYKYEGSVADSIKRFLTLEENRISGFGQINWSPVKYIDIVIGGRYDYSSGYNNVFNPRIGLIISPFNNTFVKYLYCTAFQAPSLFFQYEQWGSSSHVMLSASEVKKYVDPNWELKNQTVKTNEISITQIIGKTLQIKASYFCNHLTDLIQRVTFDTLNQTYNKYYNRLSHGIRNENIGEQSINGFVGELNFVLFENIETYVYYCYTKGLILDRDKKLDVPRISEHKFWGGISYYNLLGYINISARCRWIGQINNTNLQKFPSGKQPGYLGLDLSLTSNKIFGFFKTYIVFNNLLNKNINHAGLFQQSGGYLSVVPQEELFFKIGVELAFFK